MIASTKFENSISKILKFLLNLLFDIEKLLLVLMSQKTQGKSTTKANKIRHNSSL
jgi:hypothetical protein